MPKYAKGDKCPKKHYLGSLQKTMPQAAGEIIIKIFPRPEVPKIEQDQKVPIRSPIPPF